MYSEVSIIAAKISIFNLHAVYNGMKYQVHIATMCHTSITDMHDF